MEGALVSAATGALKPFIGKLGALLGDEYRRLKKIRKDINSLTLELKAIDAFLENMSEEEDPNPQDRAWMNEVRELSYDVEDNIDDFVARVGADKSSKPDGFMDKVTSSLKRLKARHDISKAIEDLKKQAIEVSQRNARYRSGEAAGGSNTSNSPKVDRRALAIFEDASKLVGVDGPKRELIQLLADCDPTKQHPNVVSVVGFGGLGKTTLANKVYQELKGQFHCHAFVSVSRNPDIRGVMATIYSQLNKNYHPRMEELQQLITMMLDFLRDKRYLIVVDDIWKVEIWEIIKCAFPTTGFGNKIITTTRINDVAQSCCSQFGGHIYNIRPLSMVHSRQLLLARLFNPKEKCPSHLEGISDQILEKCAGLPLSIIAISGVLADKENKKDLWEQVKDSVGRALRTSCVDDMVNIISLSYLDLPRHLKTCALYLSIFPEDHIIEKENLIRRWIGEGFIQKRAGYNVHESGEMCFNELINRSLIQPMEIDETFSDHEVKSCRVHDTILDFLVSKAVEENFVTIIGVPGGVNPDPGNKVRRLSVQNEGDIPPGLVLTSARSLHVFGRNVKIPSLSEFRLLRVMDFAHCFQLQDDDLAGIGNLLHLKFLSFHSVGDLKKFPEQVARLPHVEIDISGYLREMEIPATICRLQQFVTLDLGFDTMARDEVAAMEGLRVLKGINVYYQSTEFLEGLGQMKNLSELDIIFNTYDARGDAFEDNNAVVATSISELGKANLKSVHVNIHEEADAIFGESWFPDPPYGLRELVVKGVPVNWVPSWIASLVNLEKLHLTVDSIDEEDMEILGGLPSLRHLSIMFWQIDGEDSPELEDALKSVMETHPNRPTLVWKYEIL